MRGKGGVRLLAVPVLAMSLQGTGALAQSGPSPGRGTSGDPPSGLVGKVWELDLKADGCGPPLGVSPADQGLGIVKRTLVFGDQGMLRQQDTISPGNEIQNQLQAQYAITGDTVNIRWKPEDQQVDIYKIAGLTDTSVTLAGNVYTCRYTRAPEAPAPGTPAPGAPVPGTPGPESPAPETPTP